MYPAHVLGRQRLTSKKRETFPLIPERATAIPMGLLGSAPRFANPSSPRMGNGVGIPILALPPLSCVSVHSSTHCPPTSHPRMPPAFLFPALPMTPDPDPCSGQVLKHKLTLPGLDPTPRKKCTYILWHICNPHGPCKAQGSVMIVPNGSSQGKRMNELTDWSEGGGKG